MSETCLYTIFKIYVKKVLRERPIFVNILILNTLKLRSIRSMLAFFRKYQRYFFLVITFVIIISFSFFGTYSTLTSGSAPHEQTAFTAINGARITRADLDRLVMFIGTDAEDKILFGGIWGPNFLNNGTIKKDFFYSGLGEILASAYSPELAQELNARHEKEKRYSLYAHPQAKFVGVETAWTYLAPEIKTYYDALKSSSDPASPESIKNRINLYLAEKKLPAPFLRQVLLYQQQQYGWLTPDPALEQQDFSLFGYHTVEDWFGPKFVHLVGEFIINAAIAAEQKGYKITRAEALADLMYNSEMSFKQMQNSPYLGVANSSEYFNEQLRRMQLDQNHAADTWRQVLLFRRWFNDVGSAVFVDPLMFEKYDAYATEKAVGNLYQLPKEFHLGSFKDLQQFEIYLNAIDGEKNRPALALPEKFRSVQEVAETTPELVQKRYLLEVASVNLKSLQSKVGLKETWNWEVEDANWPILQLQFADLGAKTAASREERFKILDALDDRSRTAIDAFARQSIVKSHPEWLDDALNEAESQPMTLKLRLKGDRFPFEGLKDPRSFMAILDKAKIEEPDPALSKLSFDGSAFYRIIVKNRSPDLEVLTFAEAQQDGVLEDLLNKKLEAYYLQVRENNPKDFQKEDKTWQIFDGVKTKVAEMYFAPVLKAIRDEYNKGKPYFTNLIDDVAASRRFYSWFTTFLEKAKQDPNQIDSWIQPSKIAESTDEFANSQKLGDQWKLLTTSHKIERGSNTTDINLSEIFQMGPETWSSIQAPVNGDLSVFYLTSRKRESAPESVNQRVLIARNLLSDGSQRVLMENFLQEIKDRKAISLDYLNPPSDEPTME